MKRIFTFFTCMSVVATLFAQQATLTFTGRDQKTGEYVQLTRVVVKNITQDWTETLTYPDTVAVLNVNTGIEDGNDVATFGLSQNRPNPFMGKTNVTLNVTTNDPVMIDITDVVGRTVYSQQFNSLRIGANDFRLTLASVGTYMLTARQNNQASSIKVINYERAQENSIAYVGETAEQWINLLKAKIEKAFFYGDEFSFQGYANIGGDEKASQLIQKKVVDSEDYLFTFENEAEEFVCGTSFGLDYDGNVYPTVLIGDQCWMKENLRSTHYSTGVEIEYSKDFDMSNSIPYRFYPDAEDFNVPVYGYLYNWAAVMNGRQPSDSIPSGVQGICPIGWHVPSAAEYLKMYDYMKSTPEYVCDTTQDDRYYIVKALSAKANWEETQFNPCAPGYDLKTNDASGFSLQPAGCFYNYIQGFKIAAYLWTTTEQPETWQDDAMNQFFSFGISFPQNSSAWKESGYSVRCLKD